MVEPVSLSDGEEGREGGLEATALVVAAAILVGGEGDGDFGAGFAAVVLLAAAVVTLSCAVTVPASSASPSSSSEALMVAFCMCLRFTWKNVHPDHAWEPILPAPATRMPRTPELCLYVVLYAGGRTERRERKDSSPASRAAPRPPGLVLPPSPSSETPADGPTREAGARPAALA